MPHNTEAYKCRRKAGTDTGIDTDSHTDSDRCRRRHAKAQTYIQTQAGPDAGMQRHTLFRHWQVQTQGRYRHTMEQTTTNTHLEHLE